MTTLVLKSDFRDDSRVIFVTGYSPTRLPGGSNPVSFRDGVRSQAMIVRSALGDRSFRTDGVELQGRAGIAESFARIAVSRGPLLG